MDTFRVLSLLGFLFNLSLGKVELYGLILLVTTLLLSVAQTRTPCFARLAESMQESENGCSFEENFTNLVHDRVRPLDVEC